MLCGRVGCVEITKSIVLLASKQLVAAAISSYLSCKGNPVLVLQCHRLALLIFVLAFELALGVPSGSVESLYTAGWH